MTHRSRNPLTGALVLVACLVLLRLDPASAETYKWSNKDGTVGFTDSLEKVPPQYRESAKRLEETKESTKTFQRVPTPPGLDNTMPSAPTDQGEPYTVWRQRMSAARAELEELRAKRGKAQTAYDALRRPKLLPPLRLFPIDPEEAQTAATLKELEQRIRDKEYEINTTIPDEARRAGVPPGILSQ